MKIVLSTSAVVLAFATAVFAQNTTRNDQVGDYQKTYQQQSGSLQNSTISQLESSGQNYGNHARTTQAGTTANNVVINQSDGASSNYAEANQVAGAAAGNTALLSQSKNSGGGTPNAPVGGSQPTPGSREGNYASLQQAGSNNAVILQEGGPRGGSNGNVSVTNQFGSNTASVYQLDKSASNVSTVNQGVRGTLVTGSEAVVSQTGGAFGGSTGNTAVISQAHSGQTATVYQTNYSAANTGIVNQEAGMGTSTILQNDVSYANDARINQLAGSGVNTATITETTNSHDNMALINQHDANSTATIDQIAETANNAATINQGAALSQGVGNVAFIRQSYAYAEGGLSGNMATISQNTTAGGGGNVGEIYQGKSPASVGYARIEALGISSQNMASVNQQGSNNRGRVFQVGDGQSATVSQLGSNNVVRGTGLNEFLDYATQYGSGNTLSITQTNLGGAAANTAASFQYGTGNANTVIQTGSN
jgi:Curlin associated repeat